jgi:uncharacterized protein (DUF1330 family)
MTVYVIATHDKVLDHSGYETYKKLAVESITKFNGRLITRAKETKVISGNWSPERIVIIEFSCAEDALLWSESAEYKKACSVSDVTAINRKQIMILDSEDLQ